MSEYSDSPSVTVQARPAAAAEATVFGSARTTLPDLVDVHTAAAALGVSPWSLYRWASAGAIPHVRAGRLLRFVVADVVAALQHQPGAEPPPSKPRGAAQPDAAPRRRRAKRPVPRIAAPTSTRRAPALPSSAPSTKRPAALPARPAPRALPPASPQQPRATTTPASPAPLSPVAGSSTDERMRAAITAAGRLGR